MSFKNKNHTLARKKNKTLFRNKNSTLIRKPSWTLLWKQKNRHYFGCHKGFYLGRKKDIF